MTEELSPPFLSLADTNFYIMNTDDRAALIKRSVETSSAVEGIQVTQEIKLKVCPKCHSDNVYGYECKKEKWSQVACFNCDIELNSYVHLKDAIEEWNERE